MIRIASTLAFIALPASLAFGQSFQTALPLDPVERRAMEARLSTILDFARPGEVSRFTLPSGRILAVRPYRAVRRPGEAPCRGYRIDLLEGPRAMAVDGFRCRRSDGAAWLIAEPEIVLAQDGGPLDLTGTVSPLEGDDVFDAGPAERADEPRRDGGSAFFSPGEVAPVPRPAPRAELAAARADEPAAADPVADGTADAAGGIAAAPLDPLAPEPLRPTAPLREDAARDEAADEEVASEEAASEDGAPVVTTPLAQDGAPAVSAETAVPAEAAEAAAPRETPPQSVVDRVVAAIPAPENADASRTRVVGERIATDPEAPASASPGDPRVLSALRDLAYLADGAPPSPDVVQEAIDAFARDERFALPVSSKALMSRLDAALARRHDLPDCASAPAGVPCLLTE